MELTKSHESFPGKSNIEMRTLSQIIYTMVTSSTDVINRSNVKNNESKS